nr:cupin domain-containing protein [Escherichia coli]MDN1616422.1 cupin domain-containing protein [Escherichia coli]MDN1690359.1 cupin domain-containing protein [Escherichia coli]
MFVFNEDTAIEDLGNGVKRKVLAHGGNMMAVEVHFSKGAIGSLHHHQNEQLTYVLSGIFEFTIGDEVRTVKTGDTLYKQPNIVHGCKCLEKGVLLDIFTPQRQDFLK